ncbi:hypothetical protein LTS12_027738, partial [Elasticomyces elasticus]
TKTSTLALRVGGLRRTSGSVLLDPSNVTRLNAGQQNFLRRWQVYGQEVEAEQEADDRVPRDLAAQHTQWCQPRRSQEIIRRACSLMIPRRKPDLLERRDLRPTL